MALRSGGEGELANQILQEGSNSPADVFYAGNSPALEASHEQGLLAPVEPATLAAIPTGRRARPTATGSASPRAPRCSSTTPAELQPADLPASLLDLAKPEWKGRFGFAADRDRLPAARHRGRQPEGRGRGRRSGCEGLKDNGTTYDDNEAIIAAVNRGDIAAGLVEHYYWYRLRDELGADRIDSALHYFAARRSRRARGGLGRRRPASATTRPTRRRSCVTS